MATCTRPAATTTEVAGPRRPVCGAFCSVGLLPVGVWIGLLLLGCAGEEVAPSIDAPPAPNREFRGVWVATVTNIDWPSSPTISVLEQQAEAVAILDRVASLNMNTVVFQVRPHADALYESELEPWSAYLTGEQGRAPEPRWDPLRFWVEESHRRALQLHAWFNPYRANHPGNPGEPAANSIQRTRPDLVVKLGDDGYYWMDPSLRAVQDHVTNVVLDVVRRYDIDGVHFDDYFYPYASYNGGADFPDEAGYRQYRDAGGTMSRHDWRRAAVDGLIERLVAEIHSTKPHVMFGISPFGIWRPGHPPSIRGLDAYDALYADARRWLDEGWVDYLSPQLYWPISKVPQSFPVLLGWWLEQNSTGRHVWPGTSIGRMRGDAGPVELQNQVMVTRGMAPQSPGLCMFSMKVLQRQPDPLGAGLLQGPYAAPALVPKSPWLDAESPMAPSRVTASLVDDQVRIAWEVAATADASDTFCWVVTVRRGKAERVRWLHQIVPAQTRSVEVAAADAVWVAAVGRTQLLSEARKAAVDEIGE